MSKSILVHILTFNSEQYILPCLEALMDQKGFITKDNLCVEVTDNASDDETRNILLSKEVQEKCDVYLNEHNIGFCAAHNAAATRFLKSDKDYLLILNPDVRLKPDALSCLLQEIEAYSDVGTACIRLYRADNDLNPLEPLLIDSAGIYVNNSLRHFDRGAGQKDDGYSQSCFVFGGTGACLLLTRNFIEGAEVRERKYSEDLFEIYPQLKDGYETRCQLFDEAFFAYREDADLGWRAQILGWKCLYAASAVGYHKRLVTPERRGELNPLINLYGVRNRFLLQLNNYRFSSVFSVLSGLILRNVLVILVVLFFERSSLAGLKQAVKLRRRALERRSIIFKNMKNSEDKVARWFRAKPYVEPL